MSLAVGIDLGTTNSAVARIDTYGRPEILRNRLGETTTPSVLCFIGNEERVVVGLEAKELQAGGAQDVAAFFKRQMGVPGFVFHAAGQDHSAVDLSVLLLARLKDDAEAAVGEPITHAVITVPAYFKNLQREETISAGRRVGLEVLQVINEPTAAAVAYGSRCAPKDQRLLVYDLGGGTFDVTLLQVGPKEIRILTSDGDHELGGKDWDDRIVEFLASRFEAEHGLDPLENVESLSDLLVRAEEVKKRLSATESAPISIVHEGRRGRYVLDRTTLEEITADLIERTMALTRMVMEDQSLRPDEIDGVLLVGGSTRMAMVSDRIRRAFGREPLGGVNVDEAVALGAAIVASDRLREVANKRPIWALGGVRAIDVTNHSLGMIALNEDSSAFVNSLILPKNTPIPCNLTRPYQHRTRRQAESFLEVFMTQGESESPGDVTYLGKYVLHDMPSGQDGLTVVDIEYSYDQSGTVQVAGKVQGKPLRLTVEPLPCDVPERFLQPPELISEVVHATAYLAFDLSGSMSGKPLAEAKKAAKSFLHNTDLSHCSLGIVAFADRVTVSLEASQNAREIERKIDQLSIGEVGFGNAADPFAEVLRLLANVSGPRFVVTLADGRWSDQPAAVLRARACHAVGIESVAIGFGGADREFLKAIASTDEASFFTSLEGLSETFAHIAQVLTKTQSVGALGNSRRP